MARLFVDLISGTVTDDPLLVGATTLNSAILASVPAVTGSDILALTLDPESEHGTPEIVHITAHTASATSATILRGQEGTSAREHPVDTKVIAALTADAIEELEAAIVAAQAAADEADDTADTAQAAANAAQADADAHASRHATDGDDDLAGAIAGYVSVGSASNVGTIGTSESTQVTTTFTKPASWNTYTLIAWGGGLATNSSLSTNPNVTAKLRIAAQAGDSQTTDIGATSSLVGNATFILNHIRTGLTGNSAVDIRAQRFGAGAVSCAAVVNYIAIRTS